MELNKKFMIHKLLPSVVRPNYFPDKNSALNPSQQQAMLPELKADSVMFSGVSKKKADIANAKFISDLAEKTLDDKIEWERREGLADFAIEKFDAYAIADSAIQAKLEDGSVVTLCGDFLDSEAGSGLYMSVDKKGKNPDKPNFKLLEGEFEVEAALDLFNKAFMLNWYGPQDDLAEETREIKDEINAFRAKIGEAEKTKPKK